MLNGSTYMVRPAHAAVEELLQLFAHLEGIHPVVGGAGAVFRERADERAIFDARDIVGVGTGVVAARPQLLVELDQRAAGDHFGAELLVFFLRAVDPMDGGGLGQGGDFIDPVNQVRILAQRLRGLLGGHLHDVSILPRLCVA